MTATLQRSGIHTRIHTCVYIRSSPPSTSSGSFVIKGSGARGHVHTTDAQRREVTGEGAALALDAAHIEPAAMALQRMLDDRQPETGAALAARTSRIDAVEALGEPREV